MVKETNIPLWLSPCLLFPLQPAHWNIIYGFYLQSILCPHYFSKSSLAKVSSGIFLAKNQWTHHSIWCSWPLWNAFLSSLSQIFLPHLLLILLLLWLSLPVLLCSFLFLSKTEKTINVKLPTVFILFSLLLWKKIASINVYRMIASGAEIWSKTFP